MTLPCCGASHLEHKLAPPPLLLVQALVNTIDLDLRTDVLAHADEARAWLANAGLRNSGPSETRAGGYGLRRGSPAGPRHPRSCGP